MFERVRRRRSSAARSTLLYSAGKGTNPLYTDAPWRDGSFLSGSICFTFKNTSELSEIEHTRPGAVATVRTIPGAAYGPRRFTAICKSWHTVKRLKKFRARSISVERLNRA